MVKLNKNYMLNLMNGVRGVLFLMDDSPEKNRMLEETKRFISFLKGQISDSIPEKELSSYKEKINGISHADRIMSILAKYDEEKKDQELLAAGQYIARQLKDRFPFVEIPDSIGWDYAEIHLLGYSGEIHHVTNRQAKQIAKELSKRIDSIVEIPDGYELEITNICACGQPDNDVHIYVSRKTE